MCDLEVSPVLIVPMNDAEDLTMISFINAPQGPVMISCFNKQHHARQIRYKDLFSIGRWEMDGFLQSSQALNAVSGVAPNKSRSTSLCLTVVAIL
jgi:hypothetical protein